MPYTPAPAPSAISDLQRRIAGYCQLPTDDDEVLALCLDGINDALRKVNTRVWHWTRSYVDITPLASYNTYVVGATFKSPRHAEILNSAGNCVGTLGYKDPKTFGLEHRNRTSSGYPRVYTIQNLNVDGLVMLDSYPTAEYCASYPTLRFRFYQRVQQSASAALAVPDEVEGFIEWSAKSYVASSIDPSKIAAADGKAGWFWQELIADNMAHDTRDWDAGGFVDTGSGAVMVSGGSGVPTGNTLPAIANRGDHFLLLGPPDIAYMWMRLSDGTESWVEEHSAP